MRKRFFLQVSRGGELVAAIEVDQSPFRIGRAAMNELVIPDNEASRFQCELEAGDGLILIDRSGSGTAVNGALQKTYPLKTGDRIDVGGVVLTLCDIASYGQLDASSTENLPSTDRCASRGTRGAPAIVLIGSISGVPKRIKVDKDNFTIGSALNNNHLVIEDRFVSKYHCRIYRNEGSWFIRDLESTNGTKVNGATIRETKFLPGAIIALGEVSLRVEEQYPQSFYDIPGMIAIDPVMNPVLDRIKKVAPTDQPVLITGETGTGKDVVANAIHGLSIRSSTPMLALNCSALTGSLVESELFGHEKGAFTGANERRVGIFEAADKGTLFMDEIGDLPLEIQAKLLRVLELGEVRRVGTNIPFHVDVRYVFATNKDLVAMVRDGKFRDDLLQRINYFQIRLPPLCEHPMDIKPLARLFLDKARTGENRNKILTEEALEKLTAYSYPANARGLMKVVVTAVMLSDKRDLIQPEDIICDEQQQGVPVKQRTLKDAEQLDIQRALVETDGNISKAAKILGLHRITLSNKIKNYGIVIPNRSRKKE